MLSKNPPARPLPLNCADEKTCWQNEKLEGCSDAQSLQRQTHRPHAHNAPTPSLSPVRDCATGSVPHRSIEVPGMADSNMNPPSNASFFGRSTDQLLNFPLAVIGLVRLKFSALLFQLR